MNRFGLVYLVLSIKNILVGRFDLLDSVLLVRFGRFDSIDLAWDIWFSPQGTNLVPKTNFAFHPIKIQLNMVGVWQKML